jgi:hypothetical protein|tara:strand:- start:203 stop:412 length:210 start_codon:yes stop_codon:yes gene_type:complete
MKIGDLVKYVGSGQISFSFVECRTVGVVTNAHHEVPGLWYVMGLEPSQYCFWFYSSELELISEGARKNG